jgi:hypothetical protein
MSEKKDSNPKQAYGDMKVGLSSVPMGVIYGVALAMTEGGIKYGKHNYRDMGCRHSTYFDAACGHLAHWWEGEDIDPDSGIHHLLKAIASLVVVMDSILMGNDVDDRPIHYPEGVKMRINPLVAELKERLGDPVEPFTQKRKEKEQGMREVLLNMEAQASDVIDEVINGLPDYEKVTEMFGLHKVKLKDGIKKREGEPIIEDEIDKSFEENVTESVAIGLGPTDSEIDWVLEHLFDLSDDPDFMVVCRKGNDPMTPEKMRKIEEIMGEDDEMPQMDPEKARTLDLSRLLPDLDPLDLGKEEARRSETEARMRKAEAEALFKRMVKAYEDFLQKTGVDLCVMHGLPVLHCSDCKHYDERILDLLVPRCGAGKILLCKNPRVNGCIYFERKAND